MEIAPAPINGPSAQFPHAPPPSPPSPQPASTPSQPPCLAGNNGGTAAVVSPCAACKMLRRRCVDKCVLAPYFPPTDPYKFTIAHRVFGAANIIKFLQELPESQRADAVSSMVYEANARLRDPVYGCAGAICRLQEQISQLQAELAKTQAEAIGIRSQNSNLVALVCMEMAKTHGDPTDSGNNVAQQQQQHYQYVVETGGSLDDGSLSSGWETFWG